MKAALSANRKWVFCGGCGESLCRRSAVGRLEEGQHILVWAPEWRNDRPGRIYRGPKVKRGWVRVASGRLVRPWKSFALNLPAECPRCGTLNELDALNVSEVPLEP